MSNDPLLQPFQLKHLTLKNRIMITSHEPAYTENGLPTERYRAYHEERAKGGIALTMTGGSAVTSLDSTPAFGNILAYKDEVVPHMRAIADACHEHGCAVMIQLTHMGRRTRWDNHHWLPSISSTRRREPAHRHSPKVAEDWDLERIVKGYADSAERMMAAGLDGIEINAYGHLLDQYLSPATNDQDGDYGGSLDNRMRLLLQVLTSVRERCGPDFIIGVRGVVDEDLEGGLTREDGIEVYRRLRASGLIDFLNIIKGHIDTDAALTGVIPIQGMPSAPHLDFAGEVREATKFPVFHAARISDVATARHAVATGKLDMVGLTRPHMADPHIVRKIMNGTEDQIRPCVGANYCLDRIYLGADAFCIHNPATGRELEIPHEIGKAETRKKVVVIGAGPGGLEAARVAAERGHQVTVLEAADKAGGQVLLTAQNHRRKEMISIIEWRLDQCERLGVAFRYNTWAEADTVTELEPDLVIVATGGYPDTDILKTGSEFAVSAWDIISGDVKPGWNVLVYDEAGDNAGLQAAETIAMAGSRVEIMTPDRSFAPEVMGMNLSPYLKNLQAHESQFTVTWRLKGITRNGNGLMAEIGTDYGDGTREAAYDQIVINAGTVPLDELYFELKPLSKNLGAVDYFALTTGARQEMDTNPDGAFHLYRIGDAVSARNTHAAIYDALRLLRQM